jgi:hypothetical protein
VLSCEAGGWPTLRGHLLLLARAGADPVAELLTAAALPPVVHGQVWRSRDLRARIMKSAQTFRESIQDWLSFCNRSLLGVEGPAGHE